MQSSDMLSLNKKKKRSLLFSAFAACFRFSMSRVIPFQVHETSKYILFLIQQCQKFEAQVFLVRASPQKVVDKKLILLFVDNFPREVLLFGTSSFITGPNKNSI